MRKASLILAADHVRSKKKTPKSRRTRNTPRNPQQPGDRDHLETACDETRPTRQPILARFLRSRVCGNRPRTALAISTSREVNEARGGLIHTCRMLCAFGEKKKEEKKKGSGHRGVYPLLFWSNGDIGQTRPREAPARAADCPKFCSDALARCPQIFEHAHLLFFFRARRWG